MRLRSLDPSVNFYQTTRGAVLVKLSAFKGENASLGTG
jgi:hypothetical protein